MARANFNKQTKKLPPKNRAKFNPVQAVRNAVQQVRNNRAQRQGTTNRQMPDRSRQATQQQARAAVLAEAQRLQRAAMARHQSTNPAFGPTWRPQQTAQQQAAVRGRQMPDQSVRNMPALAPVQRPRQQQQQQQQQAGPAGGGNQQFSTMTEQQWYDYYRNRGYGFTPGRQMPPYPGRNPANLQPVGSEWQSQQNYAQVPYYAAMAPNGNMAPPEDMYADAGGGDYWDDGWGDGGWGGGGGGGGYTEPPPEWWERMASWQIS